MAMGRCQGAVQVGLRDASLHRESFWPGHRHIRGRGMDSRIRLHGGRLFAGKTGGGSGSAGNDGWGVLGLTGRAVREPPLREGRGMGEGQEVLESES